MERVSDHLDLEHLKKISAVCVSDPEGGMQIGMEGEGQGEGPSQPLSQAMGSPSELGEYCNQRFWCVNIPQNSAVQ